MILSWNSRWCSPIGQSQSNDIIITWRSWWVHQWACCSTFKYLTCVCCSCCSGSSETLLLTSSTCTDLLIKTCISARARQPRHIYAPRARLPDTFHVIVQTWAGPWACFSLLLILYCRHPSINVSGGNIKEIFALFTNKLVFSVSVSQGWSCQSWPISLDSPLERSTSSRIMIIMKEFVFYFVE